MNKKRPVQLKLNLNFPKVSKMSKLKVSVPQTTTSKVPGVKSKLTK